MWERNAYAKVNIFLKITGKAVHPSGNSYHTLFSRFMRVKDLFDTIRFENGSFERFTIEGCDGVPRTSNTVYKAFVALNRYLDNPILLHFFYSHKVVVTKRIPAQAGLGGGSSDAAAFLHLCNEACNLKIDTPTLAQIGAEVGADVPFFVYGYDSANVEGFGEIITPFDEEALSLEIRTPPVACDTAAVYRTYSERFLSSDHAFDPNVWKELPSATILQTVRNPSELNDLFDAALHTCPKLRDYVEEGWYFSGSGSSFFRPVLS